MASVGLQLKAVSGSASRERTRRMALEAELAQRSKQLDEAALTMQALSRSAARHRENEDDKDKALRDANVRFQARERAMALQLKALSSSAVRAREQAQEQGRQVVVAGEQAQVVSVKAERTHRQKVRALLKVCVREVGHKDMQLVSVTNQVSELASEVQRT